VRRPRLTVRARLTSLYTALFSLCGAIVVAVSYTLVAQLGVASRGQAPSPSSLVQFVARCQSRQRDARSGGAALAAKCNAALQQLGAAQQRSLTLSHLLEYSLITLAVVIAAAAVLGWIVAGRSLRPVRQITAAARAASERDLSARVALSGPRDELRELAETFDDMLARLDVAFTGQRHFMANASHELRTPLTVMRTTIDVVLGDPGSGPDDLRAMAVDVRAAVDHADHLIGALFILARNERGLTTHEEADLATIAEDVLDGAALGGQQVHATLEPAVVSGDPMLLERLVANLVENAARYNTAAGDIWITTGTTTEGSSQLTVANTGPPVSPADISRIFEPFQRLTERAAHEGLGLGLALVASIAAIHNGTATAQPRDSGGLSVAVTIPSASSAARGTGTQATGRPCGGLRPGGPGVGAVDDHAARVPVAAVRRAAGGGTGPGRPGLAGCLSRLPVRRPSHRGGPSGPRR
jgi:signal transduction histidine kinase